MSSALTIQLRPNHGATRLLTCTAGEHIVRFARYSLHKTDWILALISVLDKALLESEQDLSDCERQLLTDQLQMRFISHTEGLRLVDRNGTVLEASGLLYVRDQILSLAEKRAQAVYQRPNLHPFPRAFKQVLAQAGDKDLSDEHAATLREAFLYHHQGQIYTLRGTRLKHRSRSQRWVWRVLNG